MSDKREMRVREDIEADVNGWNSPTATSYTDPQLIEFARMVLQNQALTIEVLLDTQDAALVQHDRLMRRLDETQTKLDAIHAQMKRMLVY